MSSPFPSPIPPQTRIQNWPGWLGLLVLAFSGVRTISNAAFWIDLATGRHIAEQGIPRVEPFTLAAANEPWVNPGWLYDLLLYRVWTWGQAPLVTMIHVIAVVVAFYLLLDIVRPLAGPLAQGAALCLAAWLMVASFDVGSRWMGVLLATAYLRVISQPHGPPWRVAAWLVPLQILWVNLDATFLWGPVLVGAFSLEGLLRRTGASALHADRSGMYLLLIPTLCVVSLLNPYGFDILPAVFTGGIPLQLLNGLSPFSGFFPSPFARYLVYATLLLGAAGLLVRKDPLPLALTTLAVISAFLVVRLTPANLPFFALFSFPFCALSLQALGQRVSQWSTPSARFSVSVNGLRRTGAILLLLIVLGSLAAWMSNRFYVRHGHLSSFGFGTVEAAYPSGLAEVLNHPEFPSTVLNLPSDGGYLAWAYPDVQPFVDVRASVHGAKIYNQLLRALMGDPAVWAELEKNGPPQAVVLTNHRPHSKDIGRNLRARPDWEPVFFNGTTTVWVLATPARADLLAQRDQWLPAQLANLETVRRTYQKQLGRWRRPALPAPLLGAASFFDIQGQPAAAAACYELLTLGAPRMPTAPLYWGINLTHLQQHADAMVVLNRALQRVPKKSVEAAQAWRYIGINALELNAHEEAIRALRRAIQLQPDQAWTWLWLERAYTQAGRPAEAREARQRAQQLTTRFSATGEDEVDTENQFTP